jgi:uncharacterized protein YcbX
MIITWESSHHPALTFAVLAITSIVVVLSIQRNRSRRTNQKASPYISHVILYPIKGCKGVERYSVTLTRNGIVGDRQFCLIVREPSEISAWGTLSQNKCPKLATISVTLPSPDNLMEVSAPSVQPLVIRSTLDGPQYDINFWGSSIRVVDQGDEPSRWFSDYLGLDCRLARILPGLHRKNVASGELSITSLFYHTPILVMSNESIEAISRGVAEDICYDRFRPNIVLKDVKEPFEEDLFSSLKSNDWEMEGSELCVRCSYPGVNQKTGILDPRLVGKFRAIRGPQFIKMHQIYQEHAKSWKPNDYMVGVYMTPRTESGKIFVGQSVEPRY